MLIMAFQAKEKREPTGRPSMYTSLLPLGSWEECGRVMVVSQ
jgi:hypothetical protein